MPEKKTFSARTIRTRRTVSECERRTACDHPVGFAREEKLWVTPTYDWRPLGMFLSNGEDEQERERGHGRGQGHGAATTQSWKEFILGAKEREFRLHDPRVYQSGLTWSLTHSRSLSLILSASHSNSLALTPTQVLHGRLVTTRKYDRSEHKRRASPFRDSCDSVSDSDGSGSESKEKEQYSANRTSGSTDLEQILTQAGPQVPVVLFLVPRPACALSRYLGKMLSRAVR